MQQTEFQIVDEFGAYHVIPADFVFVGDGYLIVCVGEKPNIEIVAKFAPGAWRSYTRLCRAPSSEDIQRQPNEASIGGIKIVEDENVPEGEIHIVGGSGT